MKIHTVEQLSDFLSAEIVWRKKELSILRSLVESETSPARQSAILRSGITVLYAHWEGFVKATATAYIQFVAMRRLPYKELTANFIALGMKGKLEEARQTKKASIFNEVAEFFLTGLSEKCKISYKDAIDTKYNLSSAILKEIICILNFDYSAYASKEKLIDHKLLNPRNRIAHGKYLEIDVDEYLELHEEIISLMNLLRNQIDNAASTRTYRRNSAN
jgi:hypothetical protein